MRTGVILSLLLGTILAIFEGASTAPINATQVETYLKQYGHFSESTDGPSGLQDEKTQYRDAITSFQRLVGLPVTGEADEKTLEMMAMPRCAIPDNIGHNARRRRRRRRRYVAQGSKWPNTKLLYYFENTTKRMTSDLNKKIVSKAFQFWTNVSTLTAAETTLPNSANIKLLYAARAHGDSWPFDGKGGVLAHAFFPDSGGDAHFDEDEQWTDGVNSGTNLLQTTVHELGHSLGLAHSSVPGSVMAPVYTGYNPAFRLSQDDIDGIRYLYGYNKDDQPFPTSPSLMTSLPSSAAASTFRVTSALPSSSPAPRSSLFPAFCSNGTLDAIVYTGSRTFAFQGSMYAALDVNGVMSGYPRLIRQDWPDLPDHLDSALYLSAVQETDSVAGDNATNSAHLFFFKGNRYWRYNNTFQLDKGYPKLIKDGFPGVPDNIDGAFVWSGNGKTYFIKGEEYYGYTRRLGVDSSYPRSMAVWRGLPRKIDAAFQWSNSRTYFFSNTVYYRFNDVDFYADAVGYPKPISSSWFNCPDSQARSAEGLAMEEMQGDDQFRVVTPNNTSLDSTSTYSSLDDSRRDGQTTHSGANSRHLCHALHVCAIAYRLLRLIY